MFSKSDIADIYPLSPMQESMLLHAELYPESKATYFEQRSYCLSGNLNIGHLKEAFNRLLERHACLRTIFVAKKSKRPLQIVLKPGDIPWSQLDLSGMGPIEQKHALEEARHLDLDKGLDCTSELPIRITLIVLGESSFELIWSMHHIVIDGWSTGILYPELMELYRSAQNGVPAELSGVVPYSRYITWLLERDKEKSLDYWNKEIGDCQTETIIPGRKKTATAEPYIADMFSLTCEPALQGRLQEIASTWQVTLSTLIHSLWGVLLGWYNDSDDIVFGSVVSGRPDSLPGSEQMVGLCINTIPVRMRFKAGMSIRGIAVAAQKQALLASDHHYCDLAELQNLTVVKEKLINHIVAVENFPRVKSQRIEGLSIQPTGSHEQINYDLALIVVPHALFEIELRYNRSVYSPDVAGNITHHFHALLNELAKNPEMRIEECEPLSTEEISLLDSFNDTNRTFESDVPLYSLFERQVRKAPERLAVADHEDNLTYQQLATISESIAGYLHKHTVFNEGDCVAVVLERGRWLPAALFGILRVGGTYVPLDPQCPGARAKAILQDCACEIVLTLPDLLESVEWMSDFSVVDVTSIDITYQMDAHVSAGKVDPAYIIYTSGSTGKPKGVAIPNSAVVNFASWIGHYYSTDHSTRSTMLASPAFDASILENIPVLLAGGSIHCIRDTMYDGEELIRFYQQHDITLSYAPPALCEYICRNHDGRLHPDLKIITGADVLRYAGDGSVRVFNNYGPTETTVISTAIEVSGFSSDQRIPIGMPIDNTEIFILDHHGRRAAPGALGELYLGGAGVAQGYLGREDLTEELFLPHPFRKGDRVYRTGDRVCLSENNGLEFLGRIDSQIQIRGFRIEPNEVERCLREHPYIKDAAVIVREEPDGEVLTAFLIAQSESVSSSEDLRKYLRKVLPEYMIPTRFGWLDRFPLTVSNKIDRKVLKTAMLHAPADGAQGSVEQDASPVEEQLIAIWRDVIGVEVVSRNDNFFNLGGHSLSATRMASRIRQDFAIELSLRVIFDTPVLSDLALHIEKISTANNDALAESV